MKPYEPQNLPLSDIAWDDLVPLIGRSNAALARYDGILAGIINPAVLLSPLTTQEAVLSSRIEGTQASLEEVLEFEADPKGEIEPSKHADINEIINYRRAMSQAVVSLGTRPLCLNLIRELHGILLDSVRGRNKAPGEFRRVQNFIGPPGCSLEDATFVPPSADRLLPCLDNWEKYLHFQEKDLLVQLAVAKAQFELIHPFLDGNGRLGRMLVPLFLFAKKLLPEPVFYISAYFESHRELYYDRLRGVSSNGEWNGWINFFLTAVIEQSHANCLKAKQILALYERMKREVPDATRSQYAVQAIDALFYRPIFLGPDFIKRSGIPRDSGMRILNNLRKKGLISPIRERRGRQATVYAFTELIRVTEDPR